MVILILCFSHQISIEIVSHFPGKQVELFVTCVICRCVYSLLRIYSLGTGRVLLPHSRCNFRPLRTDSIYVPGIVQDVPLHKRFPSWCWPVISFLVVNVMWRRGVPHNMLHLRGPKVSRVSAHPHSQAVMFSNTQSCFHWWCEVKKKKKCTRCYLNILSVKRFYIKTHLLEYKDKPTKQHQKQRLNTWMKQPVKKVDFCHYKI